MRGTLFLNTTGDIFSGEIHFVPDENGYWKCVDGKIIPHDNYVIGKSIEDQLTKKKEDEVLFTTNNGVDVCVGDCYYFIYPQYTIGFCDEAVGVMNGALATFSTKEKAEEYLVYHKPLFSIQNLIDLAKEKIKS